jgi:hypothetical protein
MTSAEFYTQGDKMDTQIVDNMIEEIELMLQETAKKNIIEAQPIQDRLLDLLVLTRKLVPAEESAE